MTNWYLEHQRGAAALRRANKNARAAARTAIEQLTHDPDTRAAIATTAAYTEIIRYYQNEWGTIDTEIYAWAIPLAENIGKNIAARHPTTNAG